MSEWPLLAYSRSASCALHAGSPLGWDGEPTQGRIWVFFANGRSRGYRRDGVVIEHSADGATVSGDVFVSGYTAEEWRADSSLAKMLRDILAKASKISADLLVIEGVVDVDLDELRAELEGLGFDDAPVAVVTNEGSQPMGTGEPSQAVEAIEAAAKVGKAKAPKRKAARPKAQFDYLLQMPLAQLSKDRLGQLRSRHEDALAQLEQVRSSTAVTMWEADLLELRAAVAAELQHDGSKEAPVLNK